MIVQVDRIGTFEQRGDEFIGLIDRPTQEDNISYFKGWLKVYHPDRHYDIIMAKCGCEYYFHFDDFSYYLHEAIYL